MGLCHYWLYFGRGHSAGYCGSCGQTGGVGHFRDVIPDCSCCVSHRRLLCQISCSRCPDFSWFPATERRGCSFSQFWPTSTSGLHRLRGECVQSVKQCVRCSERDIECGAVSENVGSTVMHCCHTDLWAEGRQSGSTPQVRVREGRFPLCWRMPSAIRFSTDGAHIPAPPTSGSHRKIDTRLQNAPNGPSEQRGHLLCLQDFEATGSEIFVIFEYNMCGSEGAEDAGEGFCAYLLDPSAYALAID